MLRPRCADERIWGGKPPAEYYIRDSDMTPKQKERYDAWINDMNSKWYIGRLWRYLIDNDLYCEDLSDEELNQFRKDL